MQKIFEQTFFSANRHTLQRSVSDDTPVIITANGLLQRSADTAFPFQQDSSFWYLTGIDEPDIILVIAGDEEFLVVPSRSANREAFDGQVDSDFLSAISGVGTVVDETIGWQKIGQLLRASPKLATAAAAGQYIEQYGLYTNPARARLQAKLAEICSGSEIIDIRPQLARQRMIKQPSEIRALQAAIDTTIDSLVVLTAADRFNAYTTEFQIEADLSREFRFRGATGHAFAPIIAGGKRACTLHNVSNEADLEADSLVVLDVGAEVNQYAADITRTKVFGTATTRQQEVFAAVLEVQDYALGMLKPEVLLKDYEAEVETYMGTVLQRLGLLKKPDHDSIRHYFPHSTSHFLGLDVHDVGDYNLPLEPDVVLTCEPGIYIPEESIGIRIEDDVLITSDGNTVLSQRLPKQL